LPLKEEDLCKSLPHKGEYGYATSKLHALHYLKLLKEHHNIDFAYGLLTNLFGPNDKFDVENGHVIPSLICKAYNASIAKTSFEVWGREDTIRDFLFVEDAAEAILHLCQHGSGIYNIASGQETTMGELARLICNAANISEPIQWRPDLPVGIPKRTIDISRLLETGFINKMTSLETLRLLMIGTVTI
jgi:GDP-L-fucose synthase